MKSHVLILCVLLIITTQPASTLLSGVRFAIPPRLQRGIVVPFASNVAEGSGNNRSAATGNGAVDGGRNEFNTFSQLAAETSAAPSKQPESESESESKPSTSPTASRRRVITVARTGLVAVRRSVLEPWRRRRRMRDSRGVVSTGRRAGGGDYRDDRAYGYEPAFRELALNKRPEITSDKNILGRLFRAERTPFLVFEKALLGFVLAYAIFPSLARFLWRSLPPPTAATVTVGASPSASQQARAAAFSAASLWQIRGAVASGFAPAVGTLYGTMQAFTISLLTERIRRIQETVGQEVAVLSLLTRHSIDLYKLAYRVDDATLTRALRPLWDHSTTLISKSRGDELLGLVEADPCYRVLRVNKELQAAALDNMGCDNPSPAPPAAEPDTTAPTSTIPTDRRTAAAAASASAASAIATAAAAASVLSNFGGSNTGNLPYWSSEDDDWRDGVIDQELIGEHDDDTSGGGADKERYVGDEEDCEEDCEFDGDDDSGENAFQQGQVLVRSRIDLISLPFVLPRRRCLQCG